MSERAVVFVVDDDPSMRRSRILLSFAGTQTAIAATLICFLTCMLFLARPAHALDPNKRLTQYLHNSWRIQDGSAPAGMFTVAQTSDGFLWFSAYSPAIYRFDGVRFLAQHLPYKGGSNNKVFKVFGGRAGGLWAVGSREIAYIKDGAVTSDFQLDGFSSFQNVSEDSDGSLWVVRAAANISDSALCHVADGKVTCFGKAEGVPISPIDSILSDGKGGFWLGGQTALVHWRDSASETYPIEALRSNVGQHGVVSVALGPDGTVWVGMLAEGPGLGLGQLKEGVVKPFVTPTFDGSKVEVFAMTFDREGNLWVASRGKGLYRIHGDVVDHYGRTDGLSSDAVNLLFEDREGILWAATSNGIDSFRDPRVTTFSSSEGLGKDAASGVLASRDGSMWIANDGSLDRIANGSISSLRTGAGLPGHQVASLLEDRAGNLWVGVDDALYVLKDGRFQRIAGPDHKPLGLVVGITEDIDGNIWAACAGNPRRLVRIRDFEVREEFPTSQVPAARTLAPDPQGGIWIATTTGDLARFRNGAVEKFALNLKGNPVLRRIVANADGSVLAASEDGLVGLRKGKVQRMTTENGLPCSAVFSFVEDKEKRWWLYTDCGVLELADSELQRWWSDPGALVQTRIYDRLDGAQPNAPYFNSAAYSPDGRVWFVNGQVVQMVDPSTLSRKAPAAPTYIESVIVDRKELPATGNLGLAPQPRDLQIDYTSPTFTVPQKVKFRYRLDSYDNDWHDAGTRRQAFYTDLPPGKYTFSVIAANSDGVWNESPAKLDFSIAPAYFQTNWFRALCAAVFLAMLWMAYRLRVRYLQRRFETTLLAEEKLREKDDALEMARMELARVSRLTTLGELTTSVAHEVSQPLGAMVASAGACARWLAADPPAMAEARSALDNIVADGKRAREVIARIRALTKRQAPRMDLLDLNGEILEVLALTEQELHSHDIVLETKLDGTLPQVRGDRVQLQQVLLNLILNAIEAMSAVNDRPRELTIVSAQGTDGVMVEVCDSGIGLDQDHAERVFEAFYTTKAEGLGIGLSISRSIIEAHGGRLWAAPNEPHGAVFGFSLPAAENGQS